MKGYYFKPMGGRRFQLMHPNGLDTIGHMWRTTTGFEACPYPVAPCRVFDNPHEAEAYIIEHGKPEPAGFFPFNKKPAGE